MFVFRLFSSVDNNLHNNYNSNSSNDLTVVKLIGENRNNKCATYSDLNAMINDTDIKTWTLYI